MAHLSLEKLIELMEAKDRKIVEELGGIGVIAASLGSDTEKGLIGISDLDLDQRRQKYGVNKMERKPPPSIFELFLDAMKDTTIIVLLIAAVISIIIGAISCSIHLGKTCPRQPLWDIGYTPGNEVRINLPQLIDGHSLCHFVCRNTRKEFALNGPKDSQFSWPA